ncbi:hypothetical protein CP10139811_0984 [Chlamydia ibidis]|uniref:Uncharacterized protein n=3 Tax=Chlamydia ibidis TaxID=1405396 RepID=S7KH08_9CHLA|nr:hypothetical protein CP10139811_0984 [Chlamydia ibidis]EQM63229.1 hypothetical protein H359_0302 [Chlamydia ibidis 10-1398/6]
MLFSQKEIALQNQAKLIRIASVALLSIQAIGCLAAAIGLTVALGSPVFLGLILVSVLLSIMAFTVHKYLTEAPSGDWSNSLTAYFRSIPATTADANFSSKRSDVVFFQNKYNPKITLGIWDNPEVPFSLELFAMQKERRGQETPFANAMMFNLVPASEENSQISMNLNLSKCLYQDLAKIDKQVKAWYSCNRRDSSSAAHQPFLPTETRSAEIHLEDPSSRGAGDYKRYPHYLGHARGPAVKEFPGQDHKVQTDYYRRAYVTYVNCLEEALARGCTTVAVPLFSSVYEVSSRDKNPKAQEVYDWSLNCQNLCKMALVEATNSVARSHSRETRLLVVLQDPFAAV